MSAGSLVIGSRTAPVKEVLRHEDDGPLVDFFKPEEIVAAMTRVCGSRDRLQDLRSSARQIIIDRYASRPSACPSS